jgi:hypothetical protein
MRSGQDVGEGGARSGCVGDAEADATGLGLV